MAQIRAAAGISSARSIQKVSRSGEPANASRPKSSSAAITATA
jgi:hypothetical protein